MSVASTTDPALQDPGGPAPLPVGVAPGTPHPGAVFLSRLVFGALLLVAVLALVMVLLLWQKVSGMQEQLARQSGDALSQAGEARALAKQASEVVREASGRIALNESRVAELTLQRAQFEDLMQSLSRSRDENLLVDIDSAIRLALQQTQVTGNAEPLLAALKAGEQRIARAAQPRLVPLQRVMQRDADRLRASPNNDTGEALQQLDQLMRSVDDLPAVNAVASRGGTSLLQAEPLPDDANWWDRVLWTVRSEARSLLRVGRIERPEAVLLSPDQTYFLRENLKLKLLNVRLAVLSRQFDSARSELQGATNIINRYFDPASRRTQSAATLLQQLQGQVKDREPVQVNDTLAALETATAGR